LGGLLHTNLQRTYLANRGPTFLTRQYVHQLLLNGPMAESLNRFVPQLIRHGCDMAQQKIQPFMHSGMQFNDSGFGEHDLFHGSLAW
jgi:hypothetical protein